MNSLSTFARAALVRALRTVAQTATALIGSAVVISEVSWEIVASGSVLAGILSILTSIATDLPEVDEDEDDDDEVVSILPPPSS